MVSFHFTKKKRGGGREMNNAAVRNILRVVFESRVVCTSYFFVCAFMNYLMCVCVFIVTS